MKQLLAKPARSPSRWDLWLGRLTKDEFAREIKGVSDLSAPARQAFETNLQPDETLRWMVYAPFQRIARRYRRKRQPNSDRYSWDLTPDWIVAWTQERLLLGAILEPGSPPQITAIPIRNLLYLQNGSILLFSWMELHWVEGGSHREITIYYNTVCRDLFETLAQWLRCALIDPARPLLTGPNRRLDLLEPLPYKFRNLIPLRLLLPDEGLRQVIFRPARWARNWSLFRVMRAPRAVVALTNQHLLIAEEDLTNTEDSYGLISTFIPLPHLNNLGIETGAGEVTLLAEMALAGGGHSLRFSFPHETAPLLSELIKTRTEPLSSDLWQPA